MPSSDILAHVHETIETVATVELTPPHDKRTETPEYRKAHSFLINRKNSPCHVCGVTKRTLRNPAKNLMHSTQMETHHYPIERSLVEACDPVKVHRDFPQVYDRASLVAFVDTPANLLVLCLTGETPVLMADSTHKRLDRVRVGDYAIGHDGCAHRVTARMSRHVEETIYNIDGVRMTGNHLILTPSGWRRADSLARGEVVGHVGMMAPQMVGLTRTEFQVFDAIVRAVPIEMMDTFAGREFTPDVLLHDPAMLECRAPTLSGVIPIPAAHVALGRQIQRTQTTRAFTWRAVQADHAATIRTVARDSLFSGLRDERCPACGASQSSVRLERRVLTDTTTFPRAGDIAVGDMAGDEVCASANGAGLLNSGVVAPALNAFWSPINHVQHLPFYGTVYDIELEGSHSFIAGSTVVHNCDVCHRSLEHGIHHLLTQDWVIQRYLYRGYTVAATKADAAAVMAADEKIEGSAA